jgi:nicotinamidase-related amidase
MTRALVVIDMQKGFDDLEFWGPTANPRCEQNVAALLQYAEAEGIPVVVVRHDSQSAASPLHPSAEGNALVDVVERAPAALLVTKSVNSAFYGDPDLHAWLQERAVAELLICGIQTNMCVETTARMAGNLGYDTTVVWDATRTFDLDAEISGMGRVTRTAAEIMATTALVLQEGGFARIRTTAEIVASERRVQDRSLT